MELKRVLLQNGETYAYREAGQGDQILVLVHGNMSSSLWWDVLIEKLKGSFKIYAPDLRGFGESTYNTPVASIQDLAQDLKLFADAVGIKGFALAGLSLGGPVVMRLAIDHPDYVTKLILLESGSIKGISVPKRNLAGQIIPGEFLRTREDIKDYNRIILSAYATKNTLLLKMIFDAAVFNVNKPDPERYQAYIEEACKQRNKLEVDYAVISFNISHEHNGVVAGTGEVDQITCPVLVFIGEQDRVVNLEMAETTVQGIGENARLVVLENTAHSPFEDSLPILVQEITKFI